MEYDIFISHSSKDEETVRPLCAYLEDKDLKCFVSYRDIPSGVSYPGAITRAMRESEMLLLILSKDSNESTQVDRELTLANDQKKKMSCFRLEDIEYSDDKAYLMSGVNWMDAFPDPSKHYFELLQDICRQLGREVPKKEETEKDRKRRYEIKLGKMLMAASKGDSEAQYDLGCAYREGTFGMNVDNEEAYRWLLKAAKKGHIEAENSIGNFNYFGIFVDRNEAESIKWYRLAALSGNVVAQSNLASSYYFGEGIDKDIKQAVKWWTLSADQGYHSAQVSLGNCYFDGEGVEQNYEKAVEWYTKAANQDNDWAQVKLARCYLDGKGVDKNIEKGIELLETASDNNSTDATLELGKIYDQGIYVEHNPQKAFKCIEKAAEKGDEVALYNLARFYRDGIGCERNKDKWYEYISKAAEKGHTKSQHSLGYLYNFGDEELHIVPNPSLAKEWYQKAIDDNYTHSMVNLALCYSAGGCLPLDDVKAAELFRQAAEADDPRGQFFLSDEYQQGDGVEQNDTEAFRWCQKSAEQSYVPAMSRLGEYYFYGYGIDQNFEEAVKWLSKAGNKGDDEAQYLLAICYEKGYGVEKSIKDYLSLYFYSSTNGNKKAKESLNSLIDRFELQATNGDVESQFALGFHNELNEVFDKALEWYKKACEQNDPQAQYRIGLFYVHGIGVEQDYPTAIEWFLKAAEQEYKRSYNELGWTYHLMGKYDEALPWAEKAVEVFPEEPNYIDTLATVYQGLGRFDEALGQFELCLKLYKEKDNSDGIQRTEEKITALKDLMK